MERTKFTQEVKDKWLKALKSGDYTQYHGALSDIDNKQFCCIGVLGEIIDGYSGNEESVCNNIAKNPYDILNDSPVINMEGCNKIWECNDNTFDENQPDFSNVIPLIETLKVEK